MVQKNTIVLVEDDAELATLISDYLSNHGFHLCIYHNAEDAVEDIINNQPELVILDVMLPGMSGMELCQKIRAQYRGFILMQTALEDDIDQMMGLEFGADDYVIKQVQPRLLLSRIKALLRRTERLHQPNGITDETTTSIGPLVINASERTVTLYHRFVELTCAEFELLELLAKSVGSVVSRDDILQQLRGFDYDGFDRSIDRRVSRLRRKIQKSDGTELIKTIRGIGYQLCL